VDLLLEQETVDGSAVYRIVGKPVPEHRPEEMAIAPHAKAAAGAVARPGSNVPVDQHRPAASQADGRPA